MRWSSFQLGIVIIIGLLLLPVIIGAIKIGLVLLTAYGGYKLWEAHQIEQNQSPARPRIRRRRTRGEIYIYRERPRRYRGRRHNKN